MGGEKEISDECGPRRWNERAKKWILEFCWSEISERKEGGRGGWRLEWNGRRQRRKLRDWCESRTDEQKAGLEAAYFELPYDFSQICNFVGKLMAGRFTQNSGRHQFPCIEPPGVFSAATCRRFVITEDELTFHSGICPLLLLFSTAVSRGVKKYFISGRNIK